MVTFLSENEKLNSFLNNELLKYDKRDILSKEKFKNYKEELYLIDTNLLEEKLRLNIENIDDFDYLKIVNESILSTFYSDFDASKISLTIFIPNFNLNNDLVNVRKIINNLRLMHLGKHKLIIDYETEGHINFAERIKFDDHKIEFITLDESIIYKLKEYLK